MSDIDNLRGKLLQQALADNTDWPVEAADALVSLRARLQEAEKDGRAAAAFLTDGTFGGHQVHCSAIRGPENQGWTEDKRCNCGRNEILARISGSDSTEEA